MSKDIKLVIANVTQIKSEITINVDVSVNIWTEHHESEKNNIWNPATCSCENIKYLASIIDDSMINPSKSFYMQFWQNHLSVSQVQ